MLSKKKSRLALVNPDKCKPLKCHHECVKACPIESQSIKCIDIENIAQISEVTCISCGGCVKKCPFDAISIVNIPSEYNDKEITHRYGVNGFRLYKLPIVKPGMILGLIGQNGIGKSSIINILSGKILPNFEKFTTTLSQKDIIKEFSGSVMHKYFEELYKGTLKIAIKPQNIDKFKQSKIIVKELIESKVELLNQDIINDLEIEHLMNKSLNELSGGEIQRIICSIVLMKNADVYIFDEPSNFLDVKQRLKLAKSIRNLITEKKYIIIVEHDLALLDYISDYVCIIYGLPMAFGTSSLPYNTGQAINMYFEGYIPQEKMKFRMNEYKFSGINDIYENSVIEKNLCTYPAGEINFENFKLIIEQGEYSAGSCINIILGENGSGKTTFVKYLNSCQKDCFAISIKDQYLSISQFKLPNNSYPTVISLFYEKIRSSFLDPLFSSDVVKPLNIEKLYDRNINELSGGELQKILLILCLGTEANMYLIDEPSANLDIEQRVIVTKIIKKFIMHNKKIAFIVEHDLMMAIGMSVEMNSRVIVSRQENDKTYIMNPPTNPKIGINTFLKQMNITMRFESKFSKYNRPKINKLNSVQDREQKSSGNYYI